MFEQYPIHIFSRYLVFEFFPSVRSFSLGISVHQSSSSAQRHQYPLEDALFFILRASFRSSPRISISTFRFRLLSLLGPRVRTLARVKLPLLFLLFLRAPYSAEFVGKFLLSRMLLFFRVFSLHLNPNRVSTSAFPTQHSDSNRRSHFQISLLCYAFQFQLFRHYW